MKLYSMSNLHWDNTVNLSNPYLDWRSLILGANKQQSQLGKDGNFGTPHGEKILRPGNHLLAELCVRAQVFSSQDAESGVLEISEVRHKPDCKATGDS